MPDHTSLIYLASPYSHYDFSVQKSRFEEASRWAARLMLQGLHVFSPIAHSHPISLYGQLPAGWHQWKEFDRIMLLRCQRFVILPLDGWKESRGVKSEVEIWMRQVHQGSDLMLPIEMVNLTNKDIVLATQKALEAFNITP